MIKHCVATSNFSPKQERIQDIPLNWSESWTVLWVEQHIVCCNFCHFWGEAENFTVWQGLSEYPQSSTVIITICLSWFSIFFWHGVVWSSLTKSVIWLCSYTALARQRGVVEFWSLVVVYVRSSYCSTAYCILSTTGIT